MGTPGKPNRFALKIGRCFAPKGKDHFPTTNFQGQTVSFRKGRFFSVSFGGTEVINVGTLVGSHAAFAMRALFSM